MKRLVIVHLLAMATMAVSFVVAIVFLVLAFISYAKTGQLNPMLGRAAISGIVMLVSLLIAGFNMIKGVLG